MKKQLLQNTKVLPYTADAALNISGFQSGVVAVIAGAAGDLKLSVEHCDTESGSYTEVTDRSLFLESNEVKGLKSKDLTNFDLDISGCKTFIKIKVSGAAASSATLAVALGDSGTQPL